MDHATTIVELAMKTIIYPQQAILIAKKIAACETSNIENLFLPSTATCSNICWHPVLAKFSSQENCFQWKKKVSRVFPWNNFFKLN